MAASPPSTYDILYSFTGMQDGGVPGQLQYIGGAFYGTAESGGETGRGAIYKFDPATGAETVLYNFTQADGNVSGLTASAGTTIYTKT